jgi:hypothetical protein
MLICMFKICTFKIYCIKKIPLNVKYAMKIYTIIFLIHMMNYNVMHVSYIMIYITVVTILIDYISY